MKPALPISFPISELEDLKSRTYFDSFHYPFNQASVPLPDHSQPRRPRLLVCHDMKGGYVDDKWVQGGTNSEAYAIWHWHLIDVFVYFSHNLVTLPPPCWTNAAHTHGVKVLGTFLTEGDKGRLACNSLLSTETTARTYAERLTELAAALGFDGWLLNMEVPLGSEQIPNLKEFVSHLTRTMHTQVPGSLVIWYDSVTEDGSLVYQNCLNGNNKPFFDLCDGIFTNYWWQEGVPTASAAVAGERKFDVYMGIDVFGRGTYGGGGWHTNVALAQLRKEGASAAMFAPGWVLEKKDQEEFYSPFWPKEPDFETAQNRWWGFVERSWGIHKRYPKVVPFYSNFDEGRGGHVFIEGRQVSNNPWCNISCQSFQPVLEDDASEVTGNRILPFRNFEEPAYSGGLNLTFKGTLNGASSSFSKTRLFRGELPLSDLPIHISYSVKSNGSSALGMTLEFSSDTTNPRTIVFLRPEGTTIPESNFDKVVKLQVHNLEGEDDHGSAGWLLLECTIEMNGYTLTDINAVCCKLLGEFINNKGIAEKHVLKLQEEEGSSSGDYYASLGHISIRSSAENMVFPPSTAWLVQAEYRSWATGSDGSSKILNVKLIWSLKEGSNNAMFSKYNIHIKTLAGDDTIWSEVEYLGVARVQAFYVSQLLVLPDVSDLKFIIQVCGIDGACQNLDDSPAWLLPVENH